MNRLLVILTITFLVFISCKKESVNPFQYQEGIYIGQRHFQSLHYIYHYYPITFDSITLEPTEFTSYYEPIEVDTTFLDTIRVEITKDSIFFEYEYYNLKYLISEENTYGIASVGTGIWITHTISEDTLKMTDYYILDKDSNYSGFKANNFLGIKEE